MQDSNISLLSIYNLNEFVAIDVETTGLDSVKDKIIEISAVKFINGEQKDVFSYLIDPEKVIPPFIEDLTGITNLMIKKKPKFPDVVDELSSFIDELPVVGHNVKFDIDFIKSESNQKIKFLNNTVCDTYLLSKIVLFSNNEFNLESITEYYNFPLNGAHRATEDSINSGKIFIKLLEDLLCMDVSILERVNSIFCKRDIPNNDIINSAYKFLQGNNYSSNKKNTFKPSILDYRKKTDTKSFNTDQVLSQEGILYTKSNYKFREPQYSMAMHISKTIKNEEISIIEAGTGLGKTYAYLLPFLDIIKKTGRPLVVSTYTKALQDQLFYKDLKTIVELINVDLNVGIIKGRQNYICINRLKTLETNAEELIPNFECHDLASLIAWSYYSRSGDVEECGSFSLSRHSRMWNLVKSDSQFCNKNCRSSNYCFHTHISNELKNLDVIVVNHALLISDAVDNRGLIPNEHYFVIDEAHDLFKAGKDILQSTFDKSFFIDSFNDISALHKIMKDKTVEIDKLMDLVESTQIDIESFFSSYLEIKNSDKNSRSYPTVCAFENFETEFQDCSPTMTELIENLKKLVKYMDLLIEKFSARDSKRDFIDILVQIVDKIEGFLNLVRSKDYISWMKFFHPSKSCSINYVMKDIGKAMFDQYFHSGNCGILCSATLSVNSNFNFFKSQIGLDRLYFEREISEKFFQSPFFLEDQIKFYGFKTDLNINSSEYINNIANQIFEISNFYSKRILVLCTSYKQASELKNILNPKFIKKDENLYVHERGRSKNSILRAFKNNPGSVLIGTMAFWEGIDLPGDELSILMMLRIPFSNPNDPYLKHINDQFVAKGKSGFNDYQVPEACLKMKQGFGRLIRTEYDSGLFIITDPRFYNSRYSDKIRNSFPIDSHPYTHFSSLLDNKKNL